MGYVVSHLFVSALNAQCLCILDLSQYLYLDLKEQVGKFSLINRTITGWNSLSNILQEKLKSVCEMRTVYLAIGPCVALAVINIS